MAIKNKSGYFALQSFYSKVFLFLNFLAAISIGLAYLSIYISPDKVWFLAFFGLAYPYILIINAFFILVWILSRKLWFLVSVFFILLGCNHFDDFFQFHIFSSEKKLSKPLKIMSYNVRVFDLYNWGKNWSYNKKNRDSIFNLIKQEQPDIICFQEFYSDSLGEFVSPDSMAHFMKAKYYHDHYNVITKKKYRFGIATFSAFPIIGTGEIKFKNTQNSSIYTDLQIGDDTVRIFNCHLESLHFHADDYNFVDSILVPEKEQLNGGKKIYRKLRNAFVKRSHQAGILAKKIKESPYPVFVCGDFNDSPISFAYHQVRGNLEDVFEETGNGIGNTYRGLLTSYRIDFILHSKSIEVADYRTIRVNYSDHYPITSLFQLKKK
jgi:endonuclease/exonuclease/phosphatase family metal-dependent hydrolase